MRIIGQKGLPYIDLPYEKVCVLINNAMIIALPIDCNKNLHWTMAIYSTEEKANKVMDMLRDSYEASEIFKTVDDKTRSLFLMGVDDKDAEKASGVFRFPDECEVPE